MTTFNLQVAASADDSWENTATGANNLTDIELNLQTGSRYAGMRWQLPSAIPDGSVINSVIPSFYFYTIGSDDPHANLGFEDVADAGAFTADSAHLTGRWANVTTALTEWAATNVTTGDFQAGPNLLDELQEVVDNQGGLAANAYVALLWDSLTSATDNSQIYTYDQGSSVAAKLDIDFTAPGASSPLLSILQEHH